MLTRLIAMIISKYVQVSDHYVVLPMPEAREVHAGSLQTEEKSRSRRQLQHSLYPRSGAATKMAPRGSLSIAHSSPRGVQSFNIGRKTKVAVSQEGSSKGTNKMAATLGECTCWFHNRCMSFRWKHGESLSYSTSRTLYPFRVFHLTAYVTDVFCDVP